MYLPPSRHAGHRLGVAVWRWPKTSARVWGAFPLPARWPQVLCLHLKRLVWDRDRGYKKIEDPVAFHEHERPDAGGASYRLCSVCNHTGQHIGLEIGGHYTSFVRGHGAAWYFCDDEASPARCELDTVLASEGYMLFYEREQ